MKKLGISMTNGEYRRDCTLDEYLARIKKAGYYSIDLALYTYRKNILHPDWASWAKDFRASVEKAGLIVGQAHAQTNLSIPTNLLYEPPPEIFHLNIKVCEILSCKELVFHPAAYPDVVETEALYEKVVDYNVRWFQELIGPAKESGVHVNIENVNDIRPQKLTAPFTRASDMMELLEKIGEPSFGLCLDTGHAHIMSQDIPEMIRIFGKRLRTVHLHDNLGMISPAHPDQHMFPGGGTIDFPAVFRALHECNFTGIINLEPGRFLSQMPLNVRDVAMAGGALVVRAYIECTRNADFMG